MQKSDAMISYEKSTEEILRKRRVKQSNDDVMHIETRNLVAAAAGLMVILAAVSAIAGI